MGEPGGAKGFSSFKRWAGKKANRGSRSSFGCSARQGGKTWKNKVNYAFF